MVVLISKAAFLVYRPRLLRSNRQFPVQQVSHVVDLLQVPHVADHSSLSCFPFPTYRKRAVLVHCTLIVYKLWVKKSHSHMFACRATTAA
jgi:hypothetical protein